MKSSRVQQALDTERYISLLSSVMKAGVGKAEMKRNSGDFVPIKSIRLGIS